MHTESPARSLIAHLRLRLLAALCAALTLPACSSDAPASLAQSDAATQADSTASAATVKVSGHAFRFAMTGGRLSDALVTVLELPDQTTLTGVKGGWWLAGLPANKDLTFVLTKKGWTTTQTATFKLTEDLDRVSFQVPDADVFGLMAGFVDITPDPKKCQLASTITRRGHSLYEGKGTHGEPDATATSEPPVQAEVGPVYFNLVQVNIIFPDPKLTATTHDGGVMWANVEPGEHTLIAHKDGAVFENVRIKCRPGVLVNPSPPRGLQVLSGGLAP